MLTFWELNSIFRDQASYTFGNKTGRKVNLSVLEMKGSWRGSRGIAAFILNLRTRCNEWSI